MTYPSVWENGKVFFLYTVYFWRARACHSFPSVAHFVYLGNVWIRTQRAALASRCSTNVATHLPNFWNSIPQVFLQYNVKIGYHNVRWYCTEKEMYIYTEDCLIRRNGSSGMRWRKSWTPRTTRSRCSSWATSHSPSRAWPSQVPVPSLSANGCKGIPVLWEGRVQCRSRRKKFGVK